MMYTDKSESKYRFDIYLDDLVPIDEGLPYSTLLEKPDPEDYQNRFNTFVSRNYIDPDYKNKFINLILNQIKSDIENKYIDEIVWMFSSLINNQSNNDVLDNYLS